MRVPAFNKEREFVGDIFAMREQDKSGSHGHQNNLDAILIKKEGDQGQANERKQPWQHGAPQQGERTEEEHTINYRQLGIEHQQRAERGGHAFAAVKSELRGPDVTSNDRNHGKGHDAFVLGEMVRDPNGQRPFAEIANESEQKSGFAQNPANVARADAAAAEFANVLA
jgi:hypothetical protein